MKHDPAQIVNIVTQLAEYYDKQLSQTQVTMYVQDLSVLNPKQLETAVRKYRLNPKNVFFPLPAKLIELAREADDRPGAEEAWALLPKNEHESAVWTDEMREAFGLVQELLEPDPIAARMAFREKYTKLCEKAYETGKPAQWSATLGFDKRGRETALREAVEKGRLTAEQAGKLLPSPQGVPTKATQIAGPAPGELSTVDPAAMLAKIREGIQKVKETQEEN